MPKANTEGAISKGPEHDAKPTPASKGPVRLVKLTSIYEAPPRCSSQHAKGDVRGDNNLSAGKSYKQKQERSGMAAAGVDSARSHGSAARTADMAGLVRPQKHGKRSARPRGRNSAPWAPLEGLLNPEREPGEHGDDQNAGSKDMESNHGGGTPCRRAPKRARKLEQSTSGDPKAQLLAVKTAIAERIDPTKRGRRSVRPRGSRPASWAPMDDQEVVSKKMRSTHGATPSCNASSDPVAQADDASDRVKDGGSDADAVEQMEACMVGTAAEVKLSNGENERFAVQIGVPATDSLADPKEINGAVAIAVQTADKVDPQQGRANNAEFDAEKPSALDLDLDNGDGGFDLSSAESALASLYGESERDSCIEFAVKLLMDEMARPNEAAEVEEFSRQEMNGERSAKP